MTSKFIEQGYIFKPAKIQMIEQQWHDLSYMEGSRHQLDIYLPNEGVKPFPVIVDLYGGGLWRGDKSSFKMEPALQFLADGFAVVSVDYSLLQQAPFPTQVYEVKAALRWLQNQGSKYNLDMSKVILMGESSGAQLAVLAGITANTNAFKKPEFGQFPTASEKVQGIIAMYGPYRVDQFPEQFAATKIKPKYTETGTAESFEGQLLGQKTPKDVPDLVKKIDPVNYFTPQMPPILGMAGTADQVVPYQQTINLIESAQLVIGTEKAQLHLVDGAHHGVDDFMDATNYQLKLQFIQKILAK